MNSSVSRILPTDPFLTKLYVSLILLALLPFGRASNSLTFFTAEGNVSTEMVRATDTNFFLKIDGTFLFSYTNGIWQIQFIFRHFTHPASIPSKKQVGTVIDYKRIPDGTREIITPPTTTNHPSATTKREFFPPMAQQELFLPWLALCPNPELPIISSNLMRFDFRPETLTSPKNEGGYNMRLIEPQGAFLSELTVTNNGTAFNSDGSTWEFPPPYANGYVQFSYKVIDVTNWNGINFPLHAQLYQFAPSPAGKSPTDLYPAVISSLWLDRISTNQTSLNLMPVPERLLALDSRPSVLSNRATINYIVSNDQWFATTNIRLKRLANAQKMQRIFSNENEPRYTGTRIVVFCILGISLLMPGGILLRYMKNRRNKYEKQ